MPAPVIYDNSGSGHNLSLGAFDSSSIAKPGPASVLLAQNIKPLQEDIQRDANPIRCGEGGVEHDDQSVPGLKKAGAALWVLVRQGGCRSSCGGAPDYCSDCCGRRGDPHNGSWWILRGGCQSPVDQAKKGPMGFYRTREVAETEATGSEDADARRRTD